MKLALHAVAAFFMITLVGPWALPLYGLGVGGWYVWGWCRRQDVESRKLEDAYWRHRAEYETSTGTGWEDD